MLGVEHAKTSRPPVAPGVDVGAGAEQHVDHGAVAAADCGEQRRRTERATGQRLVEPGPQPGVLREQFRGGNRVAGPDRNVQPVGVRSWQAGRCHDLIHDYRPARSSTQRDAAIADAANADTCVRWVVAS